MHDILLGAFWFLVPLRLLNEATLPKLLCGRIFVAEHEPPLF